MAGVPGQPPGHTPGGHLPGGHLPSDPEGPIDAPVSIVKKPGFSDAPTERNRRVNRLIAGNDVAYRLGEFDEPKEGTPDNKDDNRFF